MTNRFLVGQHPLLGTMGIWMTNVGVDVTTNTVTENFALSPDVKMEQVWFSGVIGLNPGDTITVPYPATLTKRPYVFFHQAFSASLVQYPYPLGMAAPGVNTAFAYGLRVYTNRFVVTNGQAVAFYIHYMIFRRTIGS